jgi:hypothetical protein
MCAINFANKARSLSTSDLAQLGAGEEWAGLGRRRGRAGPRGPSCPPRRPLAREASPRPPAEPGPWLPPSQRPLRRGRLPRACGARAGAHLRGRAPPAAGPQAGAAAPGGAGGLPGRVGVAAARLLRRRSCAPRWRAGPAARGDSSAAPRARGRPGPPLTRPPFPACPSELPPSQLPLIKRTRSDQSLAGLCAAAAAAGGGAKAVAAALRVVDAHARGAGSDGDSDVDEELAAPRDGLAAALLRPRGSGGSSGPLPAAPPGAQPRSGCGGARPVWPAGALPALSSDHGSSTNSLVSMESDATRCSTVSGAPSQPALAGSSAGSSGSLATPRGAPQPQAPQQPPATVTYLQATGSAASLQHGSTQRAPYSPITGSLLFRSHADTPAPSGRGLEPPRHGAFSPPPLISPGPLCDGGAPLLCTLRTSGDAGGSGGSSGSGSSGFASVAAAFGSALGNGWGRLSGSRAGGSSSGAAFAVPPRSAAVTALPPAPSPSPAGDGWDFQRRTAQLRAARGSGSSSMGRRRSSIEASMPWRAKLDSAIAAADSADAAAAPPARRGAAARPAPLWLGGESVEDDDEEEGDEDEGLAAAGGAGGLSPIAASRASDRRSSSESDGERDGGERRGRASTSSSGSGSGSGTGRSGGSPAGRPRHARRKSSATCASGYYSRQAAGGAAFELFVRLNRARQTLGGWRLGQPRGARAGGHAGLRAWLCACQTQCRALLSRPPSLAPAPAAPRLHQAPGARVCRARPRGADGVGGARPAAGASRVRGQPRAGGGGARPRHAAARPRAAGGGGGGVAGGAPRDPNVSRSRTQGVLEPTWSTTDTPTPTPPPGR